MTYRIDYEPKSVGEALALAEAHVRAIGYPHMSPLGFVREHRLAHDGTFVSASWVPNTKIRLDDLLPGTRLRAGGSEIEIVRTIPNQKEVVYRDRRGGLFRMPTDKFVELARQQGYRKIWDLASFLESLKELLKPVLGAVPLMWILKWVVNAIRNRSTEMPKLSQKL